jgi:hypothetical protein
MAERQALGDTISVGFIHDHGLAEAAETLGVFGLRQVTAAGAGAQNLAGGGDLKPFGDGFVCFDAFGTTHKSIVFQKERENYQPREAVASLNLKCFGCRLHPQPALPGQIPDFIGQPAAIMPL